MRKSRFITEQIIGFIKQAEAGMVVSELDRQHGFSPASFYAWRAKYGGMEAELDDIRSGLGVVGVDPRLYPLALEQLTEALCHRVVVAVALAAHAADDAVGFQEPTSPRFQ